MLLDLLEVAFFFHDTTVRTSMPVADFVRFVLSLYKFVLLLKLLVFLCSFTRLILWLIQM